jgi:hypothetical protein
LKCDLGFFFLVSVDFFLYFISGTFFPPLSFFFAKGAVALKHLVCVRECADIEGRKLDKLN